MSFLSLVTLVIGIAIGEAASLLRQSQQAITSCVPTLLFVEVETLVFIFGPAPLPSLSLSSGPSATVPANLPANCFDLVLIFALFASALSALITAGLFMRFAEVRSIKDGECTCTLDGVSGGADLMVNVAVGTVDEVGDVNSEPTDKYSAFGISLTDMPCRIALPLSPEPSHSPLLPCSNSPTPVFSEVPEKESALDMAIAKLPLRLPLPQSPAFSNSSVMTSPLSPTPPAPVRATSLAPVDLYPVRDVIYWKRLMQEQLDRRARTRRYCALRLLEAFDATDLAISELAKRDARIDAQDKTIASLIDTCKELRAEVLSLANDLEQAHSVQASAEEPVPLPVEEQSVADDVVAQPQYDQPGSEAAHSHTVEEAHAGPSSEGTIGVQGVDQDESAGKGTGRRRQRPKPRGCLGFLSSQSEGYGNSKGKGSGKGKEAAV